MATDDYWIDVGRPETLLQANLDRLAGRYDTTLEHPVSGGDGIDRDGAGWPATRPVSDSVVADDVEIGARSIVSQVACSWPGRGSAMMSSCRTPW